MTTTYKAMVITELEGGVFSREILTKNISDLPAGDVLINVKYSSLNFKDALSANGNKGVTRKYPHTPGIDAAGIVAESGNSKLKVGDEVLVTGYDFGMNTSGGFAEYIRVPAEWVLKLPKNLTLKESMIYGTAGFTSAISVSKLMDCRVKPTSGDILVTGATGGVGSVAVAILSKLGYSVIAGTGKAQAKDMLLNLGAKDIILREELDDQSGKALVKGRWAGVIDTVGGNILATSIKSTQYGGCVTCCGNVASHELSTTVYPFIIRGVSLMGVDSVQCDMETREELWNKLSDEWKPSNLHNNIQEVNLEGLSDKIDEIMNGKVQGRVVVKID